MQIQKRIEEGDGGLGDVTYVGWVGEIGVFFGGWLSPHSYSLSGEADMAASGVFLPINPTPPALPPTHPKSSPPPQQTTATPSLRGRRVDIAHAVILSPVNVLLRSRSGFKRALPPCACPQSDGGQARARAGWSDF